MKKRFLLLAALMPFIMVSCENSGNGDGDEGNKEITGIAGKTLVKKMSIKGSYAYVNNDDEDGYYDYWKSKETTTVDATMKFTYSDGLMSGIAASGSYNSVYDRENSYNGSVEKVHEEYNYSGNGNMAFTYKDSEAGIDVTAQGRSWGKDIYEPDEYDENDEWDESGKVKGTYILNMENGAAVSGKGSFKTDDNDFTTDKIVFKYNLDDQLTKIYYEGDYEDRVEFKWENGNIVNVGWEYDYYKSGKKKRAPMFRDKKKAKAGKSIEWEDYFRVEYSDRENKCNIDFAYLVFCYAGLMSYEQFIGAFGFCGKESKNLPSKIYCMNEEWDENTEDYVEVEELLLELKYDFNGDGTVKRITVSYPMDGEGDVKGTIDLSY